MNKAWLSKNVRARKFLLFWVTIDLRSFVGQMDDLKDFLEMWSKRFVEKHFSIKRELIASQ